MNKILKYTLISLVSVFAILLVLFKFLVPAMVNMEELKPELISEVKKATGLNLKVDKLSLATTWTFKIKVKAQNAKVTHQDNSELMNLKQGTVEVSVLPLIFKKLKIDNINLISPEISLYRLKNGHYKLEGIEIPEADESTPAFTPALSGLNVNIKDYKITLVDYYDKAKTYVVKGQTFKLNDFVENKHIKIALVGDLLANNNKIVNYDLKIDTQLPEIEQVEPSKTRKIAAVSPNPLKQFVDLGIKSNINSDIKIRNLNKIPELYGHLNIENLTVLVDSKELPKSFIKLNFDKYLAKINSTLYINQQQYISAQGDVNPIKKPAADLNIKTTNISLSSLKTVSYNTFKTLGIDTSIIKPISINGNLKSDFHIEATPKKLNYKGLTSIDKLNVSFDNIPLVKDFNSKIIDKDNKLVISETNGLLADSLMTVNGTIDESTNTNITAEAVKLNLTTLNVLLKKLKTNKMFKDALKDIDSVSGFMGVKAKLTGKLASVKPEVLLTFDNASVVPDELGLPITAKKGSVYIDLNNAKISDVTVDLLGSPLYISGIISELQSKPKADIDIKLPKFYASNIKKLASIPTVDKKTKLAINNLSSLKGDLSLIVKIKNEKINGSVKINSISAYDSASKLTYAIPSGTILFNDKDADIKNIKLQAKNSNIITNGTIKNIMSVPVIDIIADGVVYTSDLISISSDFKNVFKPNGKLPLVVSLKGKPDNLSLNMQLKADKTTELSMVNIKQLSNLNKILNINATVTPSSIKLVNSGLFTSAKSMDIATANKVLYIDGEIKNIDKPNPVFSNLKVSVPNTLNVSIKNMKNTTANLKANVLLNGALDSPKLMGGIVINNVNAPLYKLTADTFNVDFTNSKISATGRNLKIASSDLEVSALLQPKLSEPYVFDDLIVRSQYLNVDELSSVFASDSPQQPQRLPLIIKQGTFSAKKLKSGDIVAYDTGCNFSMAQDNTVSVPNLKTTAMAGLVTGKVTYNLYSSYTTADIKAENLNAGEVSRVILLQPNLIHGALSSNIKISTQGLTPEQKTRNTKGSIDFKIVNGQMGSLGNFEYFLNAANLVSGNIMGFNVNQTIGVLQPKNTGQFSLLEGVIRLNSGIATIESVKSQGKHLSLYIKGQTNILNNSGDLVIFGRTSQDVVEALGPLGDISIEKLLGQIPHFGALATNLLSAYYAQADQSEIDQIPQLTSEDTESKMFKVIISGNLQNPRAVKSFKWINEQESVY